MTAASAIAGIKPLALEIGGTAVALHTDDPEFHRLLVQRYNGFITSSQPQQLELEVELIKPVAVGDLDRDLEVTLRGQDWFLQRGDFHARWNPASGQGIVRQLSSPYAIDSVLRIIHSLVLADQGGFLLHAASALRGCRAFLFTGISGAGKTTIARLAPAEATLLSDEISYVVRKEGKYFACGTPFSGELARAGQNVSAPIQSVFLLNKGPDNRTEDIDRSEALRSILRNMLFFAQDQSLVRRVFDSACEFVNQVPVRRLTFFPDERVWNIIA